MVSTAADGDSDDTQDDDDRDLEEIHNQALAQLIWPGTPIPRSYQVEAFRQVCEKNTIVSMDTGLGKTLIAVMCIDFYLKRNPSKKVLMCVPTVQLAKQQATYIKETSTVRDIKVADITGGTIPATRERWTQLLDTHQVVVATGQLAKQAIAEWCYLSLEQLSLLILDECHHAVGGNPVASLMQEPNAWKQSDELPRVLGLTASYLHGRSTDFQGRRQRLEATLRSQLWCADGLQADLQRHRSEQTFETLSYREGSAEFQSLRQRCGEELQELLQAYTRDDSGPLWECRQDIDRLIEKAERAFNQAGFYGWLALVKTKILPAVHDRLREKQEDRWRVAEAEAAWDALRPANSVAASGKLEKLVELLEEFQGEENVANRILVFVAQVDDAYALAVTINRYLGKPVATYLSGVNSMTPAEQQKALKAFADGTYPVMVATPALEEGIDVPSCNVVIRYDAFQTTKSHIQGAGRARKKDARIFYFENDWEEEEVVRDLMKQAEQQPFEPLKEEAAQDLMKQAVHRPTQAQKDAERLLARELAVEVLPRGVSKSKARPRPPRDAPAEDLTTSDSTSLPKSQANGTSGAPVDVGYAAVYPLILQQPCGWIQVDAYNCMAILQEFVERSDDPAFPIFAREEGIIVRCAAPTKPETVVTEDEVAKYWRQVSGNTGESSIFDFLHWLDPDRYQRWSWDETQQHRFAMVLVSRLAQDSQLEGRNRPSDYALGMWPPVSQEAWKDPFDENDPWAEAIHARNGDKAWKDPFDENDPWAEAIRARNGDKDGTTASHQQRSWQQQRWASDWQDDSSWWSSGGGRDRYGSTERDRQSWWQSQGGSSWWQQGGDSWSRWTQSERPAPKATAGPWRPKEEESARGWTSSWPGRSASNGGSASRPPADGKWREPEKVAANSLPTPAPAKLSGGSGSSGGTKDPKPARAILNEFLMAYAGRNLSKGDLDFETEEQKGRRNSFVSTLTLCSIGGKYGEGMKFTGEARPTKQEAEHSASYKALVFLDPKGRQGRGEGKALKTCEPPAPSAPAALALVAAAPQAWAAKVAAVANPKGTLQELIMKKTKRQNSDDFSYTALPEDGPPPYFVRLRIGSFVLGGAAALVFDSKPFPSKTKRFIKEAEEDAATQALADLYPKEVNALQQPSTARTQTPAEATGTRGAGDPAKSVEIEEAVYTAVFLDSESQQSLMDFCAKSVPRGLPSEWTQFCDHMTICLGSLSNPKTPEDQDRLITETVQKDLDEYEEGQEFELQVVSVGRDESVLAVGVVGCSSCNRYPHITVATAPGSKPSQSNSLKDWTPLSAEEQFTLKGVLQQKSKLANAQKLEDGILEPLPPQPTARVVLVRPDGKERSMIFLKATLIAELIEQHRPAVLKEEEIDLIGPGKMVLLPDMTLEDCELLETDEEVPRFIFRKTDHGVRKLVDDEGSDAQTAAPLCEMD